MSPEYSASVEGEEGSIEVYRARWRRTRVPQLLSNAREHGSWPMESVIQTNLVCSSFLVLCLCSDFVSCLLIICHMRSCNASSSGKAIVASGDRMELRRENDMESTILCQTTNRGFESKRLERLNKKPWELLGLGCAADGPPACWKQFTRCLGSCIPSLPNTRRCNHGWLIAPWGAFAK